MTACVSIAVSKRAAKSTPFYDPMIAKLIAHAKTRDEALDRLASALEHTVLVGPRSNAGFLAALCRAQGFRKGQFDTGFIERNLVDLGAARRGTRWGRRRAWRGSIAGSRAGSPGGAVTKRSRPTDVTLG